MPPSDAAGGARGAACGAPPWWDDFVLLTVSWLVSTPSTLSAVARAVEDDPPWGPGFAALAMQPFHTAFYHVVLSSLTTIAWAERAEGQRWAPPRQLGRPGALVAPLAAGLAVAACWRLYVRRWERPVGPEAARRSAFRFCCWQLAASLGALAAASGAPAPAPPRPPAVFSAVGV